MINSSAGFAKGSLYTDKTQSIYWYDMEGKAAQLVLDGSYYSFGGAQEVYLDMAEGKLDEAQATAALEEKAALWLAERVQ